MLRPTGPGLIDVNKTLSSGSLLVATLYNFDIDGDMVKPEHQDFLINRVAPLLKGDRGHVWMVGAASQSGTATHDLELSKRRVGNMAAILRGLNVLDRQMQLEGVGKTHPTGHLREEAMDRGVTLVVYPMPRESKKPSPIIPPLPPVSTTFKMKVLNAAAAEIYVVGAEGLAIRIVDTTNNRFCDYGYIGINFGPGTPTITSEGPWNTFRTNNAVRVSQFAGLTTFVTGGTLHATKNVIHFYGLPHGISTDPHPISISTGITFGAGITAGAGKLMVDYKGEQPYTGD